MSLLNLTIQYIPLSDTQYKKQVKLGSDFLSTKVVDKKTADVILDTSITFEEKYKGWAIRDAIADDAEYFQWLISLMDGKYLDESFEMIKKVVPKPKWV